MMLTMLFPPVGLNEIVGDAALLRGGVVSVSGGVDISMLFPTDEGESVRSTVVGLIGTDSSTFFSDSGSE